MKPVGQTHLKPVERTTMFVDRKRAFGNDGTEILTAQAHDSPAQTAVVPTDDGKVQAAIAAMGNEGPQPADELRPEWSGRFSHTSTGWYDTALQE